MDVVEHHVEVYEAVPGGDSASADQPVCAMIYETAVETQYPPSAGAEMPSGDSGDARDDDGHAAPADEQTVADADLTISADGHTAVDGEQAVPADDDTMPDMPAQTVAEAPAAEAPADDPAPSDVAADVVVDTMTLDQPAPADAPYWDALAPALSIPESSVYLPPETPAAAIDATEGVTEMPAPVAVARTSVAEIPTLTPTLPAASPAPESRAVAPAPYFPAVTASKASKPSKAADALETMIGVLVVLIVLVLLALVTVLFAGGLIHR
jgi:hypothetical protein